ncbi:MAG: hypothetical protein MZU79_08880 [Anaerotruncus sp.]|nr:hypothetical protein [Anaerotruncus sp.]
MISTRDAVAPGLDLLGSACRHRAGSPESVAQHRGGPARAAGQPIRLERRRNRPC